MSGARERGVSEVQRVAPECPSRSLLRVFNWYTAWYIWLHFRSLRAANVERFQNAMTIGPRVPTIIFLNHASWWDPLVCIRIARRLLPGYDHYAPMDAAALRRYGFFRKVGLFPIELGTMHGAMLFLQTAQSILQSEKSILWITPQGRFTDVRKRPVRLMAGLGALVHRLPACHLIPLAVEYVFWDERLPEILCNFGVPVEVIEGRARSSEQWTRELARSLEDTMNELAALAQSRDESHFQTFSARRVGVGGIYQVWLRVQSRLRGKRFHPEHRSIGDA